MSGDASGVADHASVDMPEIDPHLLSLKRPHWHYIVLSARQQECSEFAKSKSGALCHLVKCKNAPLRG
ncbi:hypothetical protein RvY_13757 [Ramazzottius varieornatus]|uniref:Uncharacterized protein n=1 Tax=Ramazzottius varieornatus TaxID=947166 RepID=A0A1D1VP09_RAMVA|nr:hypothetical protein RvY_13757 [Ramazzottius varieornatus]